MTKKKSILLIDDESGIREIVREGIESKIPEVRVYESGNALDAYQKFQRQSFDLVILDMGLPQRDGYDVLRFISGLAPKKKPGHLLVLTGSATEDEIRQRTREPFLYLAKPCRASDVLGKIEALFQHGPNETVMRDVKSVHAMIDAMWMQISTLASAPLLKQETATPRPWPIAVHFHWSLPSFQVGMTLLFEDKCLAALMKRGSAVSPAEEKEVQEFTQRIFSAAKNHVLEQGFQVPSIQPTVTFGRSPPNATISNAMTPLSVRFATDRGMFQIETSLIREV